MICARFGKIIGGCKFEPRYDSEFPNNYQVDRASVAALEALRKHTYVKDVCVRCGKAIERQEAK